MTAPICSRCGEPKRARPRTSPTGKLSHHLYCPCTHRIEVADWIARNPEKRAAHRVVEKAIKSGALVRQACEVCGAPEADAHHPDYRQPLAIEWLCPRHHSARHQADRKASATI